MLFAIPAARVHLLARTGVVPCAEFYCCRTTCHYLFIFQMVFSSLFATVDSRTNAGKETKENIQRVEFIEKENRIYAKLNFYFGLVGSLYKCSPVDCFLAVESVPDCVYLLFCLLSTFIVCMEMEARVK